MRKDFQNFIMGFMIAALIFGTTLPASAAAYRQATAIYSGTTLYLNGEKLVGAEPVSINGTTYLPVRLIGEALDLTVNWNQNNNTINIGSGGIITTPTKTSNSSTSNVKFYTEYPTVPDFGAFAGISRITTMPPSASDKLKPYGYIYSILDFDDACTANPDLLKDYCVLLEKHGFQFFDTKSDDFLCYKNSNTNIMVMLGVATSSTFAVIVENWPI